MDGGDERFPWPSVVVGLGKDPIRRGTLEPRLTEMEVGVNTPWHPLRRFLVAPLYPLGEKVAAGADSLVAIHVVIFNKGRDVVEPIDAGFIRLRVDVPSLHILDWARGTFDEPGWNRSLDEELMAEDWAHTPANWMEYGPRTIQDDAPVSLDIGLKSAAKPGQQHAQRDALAALASSRSQYPIRLNMSVAARVSKIPLLVKPWRPATTVERFRHPFRTVWRRVVTANRYAAAKEST